MPLFYRLLKEEFEAEAFSGMGAKLYGGRWNNRGTPCVYLGSSPALCLLETLVHLRDVEILPSYSLLTIDVPDHLIMELDSTALPPDWRDDPAPDSTRDLGDEWLASKASLVLRVPSTITLEANALFNPDHPDISQVLPSVTRQPFSIDPRLIR